MQRQGQGKARTMTEVRCKKCNRMLFKYYNRDCINNIAIQIKCPKCGYHQSVGNGMPTLTETKEARRDFGKKASQVIDESIYSSFNR